MMKQPNELERRRMMTMLLFFTGWILMGSGLMIFILAVRDLLRLA